MSNKSLKNIVSKLNKKYSLNIPEEMERAISASLEFAGYSREDDVEDLKDAIVLLRDRKIKSVSANPLSGTPKDNKNFCPLCGDDEVHATLVTLRGSRKANYCKLHKIVLPLPLAE
jgi:hypothetical protein